MWVVASAVAADVTVEPDGTVVAVEVVSAGAEAVRAVLADVHAAAALSPEVLSVEVEPEGRCERVRRRTRGLLRPFELLALRCPTERGWSEALVSSEDFASFTAEWVVVASGSGTRVEYRVRTALRWPVPTVALREGLERAARTTVENLARRLGE